MDKKDQSKTDTVSDNPLPLIEKAISMPDMNVEVLERMFDMQERWQKKQSEKAFNESMARLQPKLPEIQKDTKGVHDTKYAKYEDMDRQLRPYYTAEGFSVSYNSKPNGQTVLFSGTLKHKDGHSETAYFELPKDTSGNKQDIQAYASALSYAKRYLLGMLLNVVTRNEDDDGKYLYQKISDHDLKDLQVLIEKKGSSSKHVCEHMKVSALNELSSRQFITARNMLNTKEDVKNAETV